MSAKVTGWVWDQELPVQRKCVLLWLAERATDNGVCFPGQAEIRQKTGLSESMVRRYLHALASAEDERGQPRQPLVRIIERRIAGERNTSNVYVLLVPWADPTAVRRELEELKHMPAAVLGEVGCTDATYSTGVHGCTPVGGTGAPQVGSAGAPREPARPEPDRESSPLPPTSAGQQQHGGWMAEDVRPSQGLLRPNATDGQDADVAALVEAFYAGLGADGLRVTAAIRRRDLAIGRQLVAAGATPQEAEAFARETSAAAGRIAPVDLRSFERERLGWLARRRRHLPAAGHLIDRTGQPPSWAQPPAPMVTPPPAPDQTPTPVPTPPLVRPALTGDRVRDALSSLLGGTQP